MSVVFSVTPDNPLYPSKLAVTQPLVSNLFITSETWEDLASRPAVAIVGSRKASAYGREITYQIAFDLARAGIVIVSGMAIGIDSIAHRAALKAGGQTIAVLPSGLDNPYPARHQNLAREIISQGGALLSEYPPGTNPYPVHFIARNRIIAALANVVIITEAARKSGTLHTAQFALEMGRDVAAVPGDITRPGSAGTNALLKAGALLTTGAHDIAHMLGVQLAPKSKPHSDNPNEQQLLDTLAQGITDGAALLAHTTLDTALFNQALTMLEIRGQIRALGNNQWGLT
jgi:DNA processing protein